MIGTTLLLVSVLLSACDGDGDGAPTGSGISPFGLDDLSGSDAGVGVESGETPELFPAPGPVVDPASSPQEISSRAEALLTEYRTLMVEVFRQMDEVYRTIASGLETSEDPELLRRDAEFYEAINLRCAPEFDDTGTMVALRSCPWTPARFELRHPIYNGVSVLVPDYELGAAFEEKAETEVVVYGRNGTLRVTTGPLRRSLYDERNPASVAVQTPAYLGERCSVLLAPTRFPEADLRVNECSEQLSDALIVFRRLNDR